MNYFVILNSAANRILGEPGIIVKYFSIFLGFLLNIIYSFISNITTVNALGFSIILLTIVSRVLMMPLSIKQHKSTLKMQQLTPEINKIKKKYGTPTDPKIQQQMNQEMNLLYSKKGVSPFSGCLPLFLQLPIFYALTQVMNHTYLYISSINDLFVNKLANTVISVLYTDDSLCDVLNNIILPMCPKIPKDSIFSFLRVFTRQPVRIELFSPDSLAQALNKFTPENWQTLLDAIPASFNSQINQIGSFLAEKDVLNTFFGLDLTKNPGFFNFPGILIPITAALTTFLSSYFLMKMQKSTMDDQAAATQKSMMYFMPLFMGYIVTVTPVGVGLYWITSNIFQVIQQLVLNKFYFVKKEND